MDLFLVYTPHFSPHKTSLSNLKNFWDNFNNNYEIDCSCTLCISQFSVESFTLLLSTGMLTLPFSKDLGKCQSMSIFYTLTFPLQTSMVRLSISLVQMHFCFCLQVSTCTVEG